jgi:hypothetical protein
MTCRRKSLHECSGCVTPFIIIISTRLGGRRDGAGDNIEKYEMGGACSSDGGGERRIQGLVGGLEEK